MHYIKSAVVGRKHYYAEDRRNPRNPRDHHRARANHRTGRDPQDVSIGKRDHVVFRGMADGTVVLAKRTSPEKPDPVIGKFLAFLARDMASSPSRVRAVPRNLVTRANSLVEGVDVDLDASLPDDDA